MKLMTRPLHSPLKDEDLNEVVILEDSSDDQRLVIVVVFALYNCLIDSLYFTVRTCIIFRCDLNLHLHLSSDDDTKNVEKKQVFGLLLMFCFF